MEQWVYTNATATMAPLGREDNTINIFARLNVPFSRYGGKSAFIERLREAWKALGRTQPMLASSALDDNRVCHLWEDEVDAADWVDNTFTVRDDHRQVDAHTLYGELGPVNKATLCFVPATQDLIIRCPHYLMDGIGHLMAHHHLLSLVTSEQKLASAQSTRPTSKMLSPPMEVAAALPPPTEYHLEKNKRSLRQFTSGEYLPIGPSMKISESGKSRKMFKRFSPPQTSALLQAAKHRGYTITHACHAAAMLAAHQHGDGKPPPPKYMSGTAFDMRSRSVAPFNGNEHPCTVYLLPRFLMLESGDYDSTVHQIASGYRGARDDPDLLPTIVPFLTEMNDISKAMAAMRPPPPPAAAVGLSSLGRIEAHLQREYGRGEEPTVGVEEVSIAGEFLTPSVALHIWTFRDRLTVQMEWNSMFYDGGVMERFFDTTLRGLYEGVGVGGSMGMDEM